MYDELDLLAGQLLTERWEITELPQRVDVGVNKRTWRVGQRWLSCVYDHTLEKVEREMRLYAFLSEHVDSAVPVKIPRPVETTDGTLIVSTYERVWWLTEHVYGRQPDPRQREDTLAVARGLAQLHRWLRSVPAELAVSTENSLTLFKQGLTLATTSPRIGFSATELSMLHRAAEIVDASLMRDETVPLQLVHGDASHPNFRLSRTSRPTMIGALDWESCRNDLPVSDLATVGQTVVFRSGSADPLADLAAALDAYHQAGGDRFALTDVLVFMIMGKFESIAHHGGRFLRGEAPQDLVLSQPGKIRVILDLFTSLA